MKRQSRDYTHFVEHPRYGRGPRLTGAHLREVPPGYRLATYLSQNKIDGTAVEADLNRQSSSPVPVLYYFDLERTCMDCDRPFIFFAEEQKHWYEALGFYLEADCIRCTDCRKKQHGLERCCSRYEELFYRSDRTTDEDLEMAECSMTLIEHGLFHARQTERVRMLLNRIMRDGDDALAIKCNELVQRVLKVEAASNNDEPTGDREPG